MIVDGMLISGPLQQDLLLPLARYFCKSAARSSAADKIIFKSLLDLVYNYWHTPTALPAGCHCHPLSMTSNHHHQSHELHLDPVVKQHEAHQTTTINTPTLQQQQHRHLSETKQGAVESQQQRHFMLLALEQAQLALKVREVPIGCVVVRDGAVIGTGYNMTNHTRNATRHAEMEAIDQILGACGGDLGQANFSSCELYVTIEPCIMCAGALSLLGFKQVFYGAANDKFGGCGSIMHVHNNGCGCCAGSTDSAPHGQPFKATGGLFADEAVQLLQQFYTVGNPAAPKPQRPLEDTSPNDRRAHEVVGTAQQQQQHAGVPVQCPEGKQCAQQQ